MTRLFLDQYLTQPTINKLGDVLERTDIKSSLGPFRTLPNYIIRYPEVVIKALTYLYGEYNRAFTSLVATNREREKDYQYCYGEDGIVPINCCIQVDMVGLPEVLLCEMDKMSEDMVQKILRKGIFEIENSIAVYQLLENFFSRNKSDSLFKIGFRATLDNLRCKFNRPIALLAITEAKYDAILTSEFGKYPGEQLTDMEIRELSGFDTFFSPQQFRDHLNVNSGQCGYLLYVRSSDPVEKMKKPDFVVNHQLLSDPLIRKVIKENTLTFNIDAPDWPIGSERCINDTKDYMPLMGMAFPISTEKDLFSPQFRIYLCEQGIDPDLVLSGKIRLWCKPAKGTYGCYGHVSGFMIDGKFRSELRRNLNLRGGYIVQLKMPTPVITNATDGIIYTFIDRNFFGMINGYPRFIGGFRNLIPVDTNEARNGRIHGNPSTVYAEIVS